MKVTKKAILENLVKAKSVSVVAQRMLTVEDIPEIKENCLQQLKLFNEQNGTNYELQETDIDFSFANFSRFKPKIEKERVGKVNVHSKDCSFQWTDSKGDVRKSYFDHKDIEPMSPNCFIIKTLMGGHFVYYIEQSE